MSKTSGFPILVLGTLLSACAPQTVSLPDGRPPTPAPITSSPSATEEPSRAVPPRLEPRMVMPAISDIDKRLFAYEEKFLEWQAIAEQLAVHPQVVEVPWQQCLRMASSLYDRYDRLREQAVLAGAASEAGRRPRLHPWEVLRADIVYLESECEAVYNQVNEQLESGREELVAPAAKLEVVVDRYVGEQRYEEALVAYRNLERRFPGWQPSLATKHAYGLALLHSGHIDNATPILQDVLPQLAPTEQLAAKRLVADLLWATHQFEEAKSLYQSLAYYFASLKDDEQWVADQLALLENLDKRSAEMAAYVSLLRIYLTFDGHEVPPALAEKVAQITEDFPGSMIAQRGRQLLQRSQEQSRGWLDRQLAATEALAAERRFAEALAILKQLEQKELPAATGELVRQLMDETLLAQAREQERERLQMERDLASRWEEAAHLLDLENYDEASAIFATLLGTEYESQAKSKIKEAANRAASEMRRQAATLFIKARESGDPDRKLDFLLESRRLLKTIIEKYPEADIIGKVTRNLEVIDHDIRQLDPGVTLEPPASRPPAADLGARAY